MAFPIYRVCVGSTLTSYPINLTNTVACNATFDSSYGYHPDYHSTYKIDAGTPVGANVTVILEYHYERRKYRVHFGEIIRVGNYEDPTYEFPPALAFQRIDLGNQDEEFQVVCNQYLYDEVTNGEGYQYEMVLVDVIVRPQAERPTCTTPPPACQLEITGTTSTAPTQRGTDDGQITAAVSGMTGSTITWHIEGEEITGQTAYNATFTGLSAGSYWILAEEGPCEDQIQVTVPEGDFRTGPFTVQDPSTTDSIVATENPIISNVETDVNSITPLYSINEFEITGDISDVTIEFNLDFPSVYSATFYSKGFPDRSNYFLESVLTDAVGTTVGSNSQTEIATSLAEAFEKDSVISRLYYIFVDGTTITLTSKETNSNYDLSTDNVTITGSNLTLSNEQSGVAQYDGQLTSNYSVYTEVFVDDNIEYGDTPDEIDYKRVTEVELPFQSNNQHKFDLSPIIRNFVDSPKINFQFTGFTFMNEMICSFYMKYGEKYPLVANSNTKKKRQKSTSGFCWGINSSLDFEEQNYMNDYFPGTGTTEVKFLNTALDSKYSHRDAVEFLNIVISKDYEFPLAVYADINMYSGAIYDNVKLFDIVTTGSTPSFGGVYVLAVSYNDPTINSYESLGDKIRAVDVQVKYSVDNVTWSGYSEVKSFRLEIDEQPDTFNIAFLNQFGTYESYTFVGEVVENENVKRESFQRPYDVNTEGSASAGFEYNATLDTDYTKTYVLNTGVIDGETWDFLQGLIQSNRLYHYDGQDQEYLVLTGQKSTRSTNDNEYSLQITVKDTINANNVKL